ncbi:MAG: hypothetical protein RIS42_1294 [Bacteroidota bacterium]
MCFNLLYTVLRLIFRCILLGMILLFGGSIDSNAQEIISVPITGEWESAGTLFENEEVLVEIDFKLSMIACDQAEFGNSNHLYRFRITNKKAVKLPEDKFLSFQIIFQDCQGTYMCKTVNLNIGVKRKNDVWDGVQPLSDPNLDNSFRAKKLISPFSEVKLSKIRNAAKDGECFAKASPFLEKMKKAMPAEEKEEAEEAEEIILTESRYYPELKIIKEAKFRLEPDVFSSSVGNLSVAKKVNLVGKHDAFWKIKYKDREGYILIADNNIDTQEATRKLTAALALEQSKLKNKEELATEKPVQMEATPVIEKPVPVQLKSNEAFLIRKVDFYTRLNPRNRAETLQKDSKITIVGYEDGYWVVDLEGQKAYIAESKSDFSVTKSINAFKVAYQEKTEKAAKEIAERERAERDRIEKEKATLAKAPVVKEATVQNGLEKPDQLIIEREAKFRKFPAYSSEFKLLPVAERVLVQGFYNAYWKVLYNGEVGYLADDMMYFKETPFLLNLKANPLKALEPMKVEEVDSDVAIYPGGLEILGQDIIAKMKYSFKPRSGKVVEMVYDLYINEKGGVDSTSIANSLSSAIDEEIAKAVKLIKPFKPARKKGIAVKSKLTVVIQFK